MELKTALARAQEVTHAQTSLFFSEYLPDLSGVDPVLSKVGDRLLEYCLRPGKAIRPLMIACGASLSQEITLEEALADVRAQTLMLSIEFMHKRLLMADDVADRDELRHDKPAFHALWQSDLGKDPLYADISPQLRQHVARSYTEIVGIWLQRLSEKALSAAEFSPDVRQKIDEVFTQYVYEKTLAGWYLLFQQNFEALDDNISEEVLLKGLELVTGAYSFQAPLLLGALTGSRYDNLQKALLDFGSGIGTLHQLTDDVLGLYGDPTVTGKPVGGDIREGKKTLLVQYAYRLGDERDRHQLQKLIGNQDITESEVEVVREIVHRSGAYAQNQTKISEYVDFSEKALANLPSGEVSDLLRNLLHFLAHRQV